MIFNSKQLEELENAHDSTGSLEDTDDDAAADDASEPAMEWRRQLIEEAAESVKRAKTRPVDPSITYEIASLLFDRETRRFARVQRSVPGYLKIAYLTGGDREFGQLDLSGYLTEFGEQKKVSELALQLGLAEEDVIAELESLDLTPIDDGEYREAAEDNLEQAQPAAVAPRVADAAAPAAATPAPAPAAGKKASAKKAAEPKRPAPTPAAKSGSANPIDDPNTYIRNNFQEMSNRELARVTGLSEHTIRRKLGEWGLKRERASKDAGEAPKASKKAAPAKAPAAKKSAPAKKPAAKKKR